MIIYVSSCYATIILYGLLVVLNLRNIWAILVKQDKYKNLTLLIFYAYSLIAVSLRLIYLIWYWTPGVWWTNNMNIVQYAAKLCVGVVHDWITVELAIRIDIWRGNFDITEADKRNL